MEEIGQSVVTMESETRNKLSIQPSVVRNIQIEQKITIVQIQECPRSKQSDCDVIIVSEALLWCAKLLKSLRSLSTNCSILANVVLLLVQDELTCQSISYSSLRSYLLYYVIIVYSSVSILVCIY